MAKMRFPVRNAAGCQGDGMRDARGSFLDFRHRCRRNMSNVFKMRDHLKVCVGTPYVPALSGGLVAKMQVLTSWPPIWWSHVKPGYAPQDSATPIVQPICNLQI
jgi:hypothetical protein